MAHSRDWCTLAGPYFPLRSSLRKKHFESRYGFDAAPRGELQKLCFHWAINEIKHESAVQLIRSQRRMFYCRKHTDRRCIHDGIEIFFSQPAARYSFSSHRLRKDSCFPSPTGAYANGSTRSCKRKGDRACRPA